MESITETGRRPNGRTHVRLYPCPWQCGLRLRGERLMTHARHCDAGAGKGYHRIVLVLDLPHPSPDPQPAKL